MLSRKLQSATAAGEGPVGQMVYVGDHHELSPPAPPLQRTYSWVVPAGVSEISAICVGAGSPGIRSDSSATGGKAGPLRYATSLAVTPGETLTIKVGAGSRQSGGNGYDTEILRGATVLLLAGNIGTSTAIGGNIGGGEGGNGGTATSTYAGGGGGAGGYSGNGGGGEFGNGTDTPPDANSGGAYGGARNTGRAENGGGVGLIGPGPTGSQYYEVSSQYSTTVGSYGFYVPSNDNRNTGFGSGGGGSDSTSILNGAGGPGACRIIWGAGRSYPNDVDNYLPYTGDSYSEIEIRLYAARANPNMVYLISLTDASNTNILASMTGVAGDSTSSFSSLSAGQFTIRSNTSLSAADVDAIKGTTRSGSTQAYTVSNQPYEYISILIKPSSAKTIKSFTNNGVGSSAKEYLPLYAVEIIADGVNLTNGMACLRGDYDSSNYVSQTITFT